jgi:preprotein translocase subunit SecA
VTKSVERAQNTVEQRNAETRKNVLKYDEVYNQQRKVVYGRRHQILDQGDLREDTIAAIDDVADHLVTTHCLQELDDTWDLESLVTELGTFWDSELTLDDIEQLRSLEAIREAINTDGLAHYEAREAELGAEVLRRIERQIMLQLIDQRWRDHLTEMAHLREGIHLRGMGQRDPLTEWQSEGFDLFSEMMQSLNVDYIRYIMHVEVVAKPAEEPTTEQSAAKAAPAPATTASGAATVAPGSAPAASAGGAAAALAPQETEIATSTGEKPPATTSANAKAEAPQPFIKDDWDKTPRNAPCPCGSGKKFKQCHGR